MFAGPWIGLPIAGAPLPPRTKELSKSKGPAWEASI